MKFFLSILFFIGCIHFSSAQNNSYLFNGTSSYVNIGNQVATGVRTIEAWVQPNASITPTSLNDFMLILHRNSNNGSNPNEIGFGFDQIRTSTAGHLRFKLNNSRGGLFTVISDTNVWNAGQWYHVAAVIDPIDGMKLFVDGVEQQSRNTAWTTAIGSSVDITAMGRQGNSNAGYFNGRIDELRLSTVARYNSNFTPSCSFSNDVNTRALYNLDILSNGSCVDSSTNSFNGLVFNSFTSSLTACTAVSIENTLKNEANDILIYPNPASEFINIQNKNLENYTYSLYDLRGRIIKSGRFNNRLYKVSLENEKPGVYLIEFLKDDNVKTTEKIILN